VPRIEQGWTVFGVEIERILRQIVLAGERLR
jgi:hypothetical protein